MSAWKKLIGMPRHMLDHRWARAHMSEEVDGQLGPEDRSRLRRHIDDCESCHRMLDSLKRTVASLGSLVVRSDPGVADRVIKRLDAEGLPAGESGREPEG